MTKDEYIDFSLLKIELKAQKLELLKYPSAYSKYMLEDIDNVLEFVKNNKIKINGKFRISKTEKRGSQTICWQSVNSVGSEIATYAGKRRNWAENKLQENIVKQIAEKQGLFISEKEKERWGEPLDTKGSEAVVYNDPDDDTKVLKSVYHFIQNKSLPDFIERTIGFNKLFTDTAYDIIGFRQETEYEDRLGLHLVLRQPYVHGYTLAQLPSENEYKKAFQQFQKEGFEIDFENKMVFKDGYQVSDLSEYNIMKTPAGLYFVIDARVIKISK